jgi:hypothetical protein
VVHCFSSPQLQGSLGYARRRKKGADALYCRSAKNGLRAESGCCFA